MTLRRLLAVSCLLFPLIASAHNFVDGQRVAPVGVADRGELVLNNDKFSYKSWNSAQLAGKCASCSILPGARRQKKKTPL